jgi:CBS domain containing-hemolysin-like protein
VLGAVVAALLLWVCSVVIPMSIARHAGERLVHMWAGLIRAVYVVEVPIAPVARSLDSVVWRLTGRRRDDAGEIEVELRSVIDEGQRGGKIDRVEREMLESVVEFRSTTVEQIMTPRTEIEALEYTNDLGKVTAMIREVGHSRIPVYEDDLDHIVGMFYVKDLMKWLAGETGGTRCAGAGGGRGFELKSILRPAIFVPETKTVRELLRELMQKNVHIAMVADEFGGTAGLVTIEDIIEEVFGEIQDEYEPAKGQIARAAINVEDRAADLDARAYLYDINEALRPLGVSLPESGDYDTLGGFVITTLGRIPAKGESFRHERVLLNVLEASPTRVLKVRLKVAPSEDETAAAVMGAAPRRAQSADAPRS